LFFSILNVKNYLKLSNYGITTEANDFIGYHIPSILLLEVN